MNTAKPIAKFIVAIIFGVILGSLIHIYIIPKTGIIITSITKWIVITITIFIIWLLIKRRRK